MGMVQVIPGFSLYANTIVLEKGVTMCVEGLGMISLLDPNQET